MYSQMSIYKLPAIYRLLALIPFSTRRKIKNGKKECFNIFPIFQRFYMKEKENFFFSVKKEILEK